MGTFQRRCFCARACSPLEAPQITTFPEVSSIPFYSSHYHDDKDEYVLKDYKPFMTSPVAGSIRQLFAMAKDICLENLRDFWDHKEQRKKTFRDDERLFLIRMTKNSLRKKMAGMKT